MLQYAKKKALPESSVETMIDTETEPALREQVFFLSDPPLPDVKLVLCQPRVKPNGIGIVICPGGGYSLLSTSFEGYEIAEWLGEYGITSAVLHYSMGHHPEPMKQAQQAICILRAHAEEFGLRPDRIGIMGFSAGGHVASTVATHIRVANPNGRTLEEQVSSRPDFQILIYPVITMGKLTHSGSRDNLLEPDPSPALVDRLSNEKQVTPNTPPAFVCHSIMDSVVSVENSRMYVAALQQNGVPVEYLELSKGNHGFGGGCGSHWKSWQGVCLRWLAGLYPELKIG